MALFLKEKLFEKEYLVKTQKRAVGDTLKSDNCTYILDVPLADALVGQTVRSVVPVAEKTAYRRGKAGI